MMAGALSLLGLGAIAGLLLGLAAQRRGAVSPPEDGLQRVDTLLPQTQCGQCGYGGCLPYAQALVRGEAGVNRCPPGGGRTIAALADLLGTEPQGLDPACGIHKPPAVARIEESLCIGCTKCIQACPVDAIIGAARQMHVVIARECTGCELCIPPCPVDCIQLVPAGTAEGSP